MDKEMKKRTVNQNTEYQLQKAVCKYLDLSNILYCASMNGQYQKYQSQRNKAKATGMKKGVPDLFIYEPRGQYHGLAIELKVGYNKPTKEQLEWIEQLNKRKYKAVVCRGIDETLFELQNYLSL